MLLALFLFSSLVVVFILIVCLDWNNKKNKDKNENKHRYHIIVDEKELLIEMFTERKFSENDFEKIKDEIAEKFECNKDEIGIIYYGQNKNKSVK